MPTAPRRSLAEEVRLMLRERILRGELAPGERVVEQALAREMGTSQGPVREALAFLCQEGLLIALPNRGTFVSEVSEAEARMAYALRGQVEPLAVDLAMRRTDEAFFQRLETMLTQMRTAARRRDVAEFSASDIGFHTAFYELAGTDVLMSVWTPIAGTIRKFVAVAAPHYVKNLDESAEDHVALIELARSGQKAALKKATTAHLNNIWRRIGASSAATDPSSVSDRSGAGNRPARPAHSRRVAPP